jgi:hypothetical protein
VGLHVAAQLLGCPLALVGLDDDRRPRRQPRGEDAEDARHEQAGADPIGQHLELGLRRGPWLGRRAPLPRATGEPRRHAADQDQVPEGGQQDPRDQVDALAHRRQLVEQEAVEQRERHE